MTGPFGLDGRVTVVTGALGRLGRVWIQALLEAGARVAALDRPAAPLSEGFRALQQSHGDRLALHRADVTDRSALSQARDVILERMGVPSVVVNNAGIDQPAAASEASTLLEDVPFETSRRILEVNTLGALLVAQVFGPDMVRAGRGSIINIGSLYASVAPDSRLYDHIAMDPPFLKPPAYGASKAALVNLTKYLAAAWGPQGVRVNALSPGGVRGDQDEAFRKKFCDRVPLRRMAEEEDLVGPLLFLASDASRYVTGTELRVDGGYTAW
jgi:NAD(P)-dependent dehydrogenase (short-subunit alcohol dehydrogenase family)